ncbi:hypothetical protein N7501_000084 [Penicillium viridicatum]|nr:hypothetical protein N7501_000084 [Penicillium viridicatum]
MDSDNDEIFPHKRVPKPPITESGASLDSGLGPSIGSTDSWSCAWPDDPVQNPLPPVQHPEDLAGIDHRYYMPEEQIPQNLFDEIQSSLTLSERGSITYPGVQLEQKRRRKDQVSTAYSDGVSLFTGLTKKSYEQQSTQELGRSLQRGYTEIQSQFDEYYQGLGQQYEQGDLIARTLTKDIISTLEGSLLRDLREAQEHGTTLDLIGLKMKSEQCRVYTLVILGDLYWRLSTTFLVPPLFSMSIDPTEDNHSMMNTSNDFLLHGLDAALEEPLNPGAIEPQDPSVHQHRLLPLPRSPGSSAGPSVATNITSPESETDSIDAGITETKNMDHILDTACYFGELDQLELRIAQILGMATAPCVKLESLDDCIECLANWLDALSHLQSEGFCGTTISILIEDQDRYGIANGFQISFNQIDALL